MELHYHRLCPMSQGPWQMSQSLGFEALNDRVATYLVRVFEETARLQGVEVDLVISLQAFRCLRIWRSRNFASVSLNLERASADLPDLQIHICQERRLIVLRFDLWLVRSDGRGKRELPICEVDKRANGCRGH